MITLPKHLKEYVRECDCEIIQKYWDPPKINVGDYYWDRRYKSLNVIQYNSITTENIGNITEFRNEYVWLPRVDQLISTLDNKFDNIYRIYDDHWIVTYFNRFGGTYTTKEKTPEIALVKALKIVLGVGEDKRYVTVKLEMAGDPDDGMIPIYTGCVNGKGDREISVVNEKCVVEDA